MSEEHLVACASCARHIRVSESACPFCSAAVPEELRSRHAPVTPAARLSRAALFALGTGVVTLGGAAACSDPVSTPLYGNPPVMGEPDAGTPRDASGD